MSRRGDRTTEFEERDYYSAPRREFEDQPYRRPVVTRSPPPRQREERTPAFLREDARRGEAGQMVLRQREVETFDRRRSPSPVRVRHEQLVRRARSVTPPRHHHHDHDHEHEHERSRTRIIEKERVRSPSMPRRRSPSPEPIRYVQRPRRSPSPVERERERERIRIIDREREIHRSPSPSPSPSPPPPPTVIRGPTVEREVITHYRDIDHGMIHARPPSPPPQPRRHVHERETDIDITLSKHRTEVDITRSRSRARSRSHERRSHNHHHHHDNELVIHRDTDRLKIDDFHSSRRRAHSVGSPVDEEERYITGKIDSRGRMGEAWGGATKDWTIVDVPPGTERVHMDGVGGASTNTSWTKYSGVRRTQFNPERDAPREKSPIRDHHDHHDHTSVEIWDREREIEIDRTIDRHSSRPGPPPPKKTPPKEMWTEITKDLVVKDAIIEMGYEYEETDQFFYVMEYLKYDDVLRLTELSKDIKRFRKDRVRDIQWDREWSTDRNRHHHHHHPPPHHHHLPRRLPGRWDDERVTEREIIYDSRGPSRGYIR